VANFKSFAKSNLKLLNGRDKVSPFGLLGDFATIRINTLTFLSISRFFLLSRLSAIACRQLHRTPLVYAAFHGNAKAVDVLVELGTNVDAVDVVSCYSKWFIVWRVHTHSFQCINVIDMCLPFYFTVNNGIGQYDCCDVRCAGKRKGSFQDGLNYSLGVLQGPGQIRGWQHIWLFTVAGR
jgi:hypothetical protein